jgi:hypothetical protein
MTPKANDGRSPNDAIANDVKPMTHEVQMTDGVRMTPQANDARSANDCEVYLLAGKLKLKFTSLGGRHCSSLQHINST